jgi:hypothetical protein
MEGILLGGGAIAVLLGFAGLIESISYRHGGLRSKLARILHGWRVLPSCEGGKV